MRGVGGSTRGCGVWLARPRAERQRARRAEGRRSSPTRVLAVRQVPNDALEDLGNVRELFGRDRAVLCLGAKTVQGQGDDVEPRTDLLECLKLGCRRFRHWLPPSGSRAGYTSVARAALVSNAARVRAA